MSTLTHSQRLNQKIALVLPEFIDASTAVVSHPRFREIYPELLINLHFMIRSSVPLMETALRRCRELEATDAVAAALIPYYDQHIKEEMHHDEWLLQDLEVLGVPRADVLRRVPPPHAAASVGSRYYYVLHHHPVAEIAGLAVMEGYPPAVEVVDLMQELSGYPRSAFRMIEKHSQIDPHHRDELMEAIDGLPLEEEHHELLSVAALYTVETASALYREVADSLPAELAEAV
jgi:pyrroloquinoline quinone (PQQ) biosynthesis protein C